MSRLNIKARTWSLTLPKSLPLSERHRYQNEILPHCHCKGSIKSDILQPQEIHHYQPRVPHKVPLEVPVMQPELCILGSSYHNSEMTIIFHYMCR